MSTNLRPFWVTFVGHFPVCVEAEDESTAGAKANEAVGHDVVAVKRLPYPANPRVGETSDIPSLCIRGEDCAGRTSCPRSYSCSE